MQLVIRNVPRCFSFELARLNSNETLKFRKHTWSKYLANKRQKVYGGSFLSVTKKDQRNFIKGGIWDIQKMSALVLCFIFKKKKKTF